MRKRWMVGLIAMAVLGFAGGRALQAQRPHEGHPKPLLSMPSEAKEATPKGWRASADAQAKAGDNLPPPLPADFGVGQPAPAAIPTAGPAAAEDPMVAVDTFLQRNLKEADDSIKALSHEAETLRARLQKVETALARWQVVAGSLGESTKTSEPNPAPQSATLEIPANAPTTTAPASEPPSIPSVPPLAVAPPTDPIIVPPPVEAVKRPVPPQ